MAQYRTDTHKFLGDSKTIHEVMMLSDRLSPSGTLTDAFGRLRTSNPLTLFDSTHRYRDNGQFATSNTSTATYAWSSNQSLINLNVDTTSGAEVIRETKRVFAYQPGKSLLIMNTFVFNTAKTGLRQRVGYFNAQNGVFLEQDGSTVSLVLRTYTSGSVVETRIAQADWNVDKFDGTGQSSTSTGGEHAGGLNLTKTNIFWIDIEWLGVGDVRCGFVVDGKMMPAHIFHNDNLNTLPYMTTATLPVRLEITNTGTTASSSTMKQICSTVISEGGYQLFGDQYAVGNAIGSPKDMPTAGTFVPAVSLRLKSANLDAIAIVTAISLLGIGNNTRIQWKIVTGSDVALTGASWQSAGTDSNVEYDLTATAISGGKTAATGYVGVTTQASESINILKEALFRFQLERNGLTSTPYIFTVACTGAANGDDVLAAIDWEEVR